MTYRSFPTLNFTFPVNADRLEVLDWSCDTDGGINVVWVAYQNTVIVNSHQLYFGKADDLLLAKFSNTFYTCWRFVAKHIKTSGVEVSVYERTGHTNS